jgi:3D (Asp-Asp-Asp) domain-containing protein/LysM repeat protein
MTIKHILVLIAGLLAFAGALFFVRTPSPSAHKSEGKITHFVPRSVTNASPRATATSPTSHTTPKSPKKTTSRTQPTNVSEELPRVVAESNRESNGTTQTASAREQIVDEPAEAEISRVPYEPGKLLIHTVTWGDSIASLARMYNTTPYKIRKRNHLPKDAMIAIDQKLQIVPEEPSIYHVRPGDTLTAIAKRFGVSRQEIERLNRLDASRAIWVGQKLILPTTQEKIDTILAEIERKKREEARRKKQYQRQLLTRLEEQKRRREREAKRRAELARKKALAEKKKAQKAARARQSRLEKARRSFKFTGSKKYKHKLRVIATAYTSHRSQTDSTPFLAAWNNRIRPGMKIIAVSPDLIRKYGLTNGVRVKIGGLPGTYVVRDKMHPRLRNHIDIYMGTNRRRALRWGRRRVVIYW